MGSPGGPASCPDPWLSCARAAAGLRGRAHGWQSGSARGGRVGTGRARNTVRAHLGGPAGAALTAWSPIRKVTRPNHKQAALRPAPGPGSAARPRTLQAALLPGGPVQPGAEEGLSLSPEKDWRFPLHHRSPPLQLWPAGHPNARLLGGLLTGTWPHRPESPRPRTPIVSHAVSFPG